MGDAGTRTGPDDEVVTYSEPARGVYKKLIVRDGRLAGAIVLGDGGGGAGAAAGSSTAATALPEDRSELLFPRAGGDAVGRTRADLPDDAQVCNCNGVSKGRIVARGAGRLPHAEVGVRARRAPARAAAPASRSCRR